MITILRSLQLMLSLFLLIFFISGLAHATEHSIIGRASVIDGDTIEIHGTRIRLSGVDAPESHQTCTDTQGQPWLCGQKAALALSDLIGEKTVRCIPASKDRYGRTLATCDLKGQDLGAWLVSNGWAVAYRHYSEFYVPEEEAAKKDKLGIWNGTFTMPWDYRHQKKTGSSRSTPTPGQCEPKSLCSDMTSCAEARFYLTTCGLAGLDRDHDGTPCETLCQQDNPP